VFARRAEGSIDLARARLSDGAVQPLFTTPGRDETWPTWSDAARRLVFVVGAANGPTDLWTWQPGDAQPAPLTSTPRREEGWPAWSRSGSELAFAFRGGARAAGVALVRFGGAALSIVPIADGGANAFFLRPRFAPDGASLVAQRRVGRDSELWILAPGAAPRPLTRDPAWFALKAAFTRDGTRIVYSRRPAAGGPQDVVSVDLAGGDLRRVASEPGSDDQSGAPSPTRDEVALISNREGSFDVYLAPLDGGPARNLTHTPDWDEGAPHWSPDGELLVVTATAKGAPRPSMRNEATLEETWLRVIDREGRQRLEVKGFMPDWMPAW
jgi:Tol biopolymer transport system component